MNDDWNVNIARKIYGIENYMRESVIDIDEEGYLVIKIFDKTIRVKELMDKYNFDIAYIRVMPAIERSMNLVYNSFTMVRDTLGYKGNLIPVFPMKVNPTTLVIESILKYGEKYHWGFNTGSIGEIKTLLKFADRYSPRLLIYDGVLTESTIQELIKLHNIGWKIIVDVESEREVDLLSKYPQFEIGIRVKPLVKLHGKWSGSVGLSSKFGLTINALVKLKSEYKHLVERSTLLHMHPGSQVYKYVDIKNYFYEVKQVYDELRHLGFENITMVDTGGGMAYPYVDVGDGDEESPDYTIVDYFKELLEKFISTIPNPTIIYEGGRFIVSSHRLVVAKVVDVRSYSAVHSIHEQIVKMKDFNSIGELKEFIENVEKFLHELRSEQPFNNGKRELYEELIAIVREDLSAKLTELILSGKADISDVLKNHKIARLLVTPTKRFVLNMSIFADIPDAVLVDQYFPVIPAQRLNEKPHVLASMSDLTCDSMGEIKQFISAGVKLQSKTPIFTILDSKLIAVPGLKLKLRGIPLHLPNRGENYYVVFLDTGAYQDTLSMKHNLIYGAPEIIIREQDGEVRIDIAKHEELYT
ncbi:MAG: decarboxylase [Desulfurococcaceae archaeon]